MLQLFWIFSFFVTFIEGKSNITKSIPVSNYSNNLNPCNDFYDYVCSSDTRKITELNFTSIHEDLPVQPPKPQIQNNETFTFTDVDKLVKLTRLMKWCTQIEVMFIGRYELDYFGDLHSSVKMNHTKRYTAVVSRLNSLNSTMVNVFYNALVANLEILKIVKIPASEKNQFFDYIFKTLQNKTKEEIKSSKKISEQDKVILQQSVDSSKSYFAFYDYNNISVFQEAKLAYEMEYHKLKNQLSPRDSENPIAEKIIRLGAIDAAMVTFMKHIKLYDERFLFQAIISNPLNDGFQFLNVNHITVVTRNDLKQPEKALADTVFVSAHEILHRVYPFGTKQLGTEVSQAATLCAAKDVKEMGDTDAVKPAIGWFTSKIVYEDVVNIMAMRQVMKMAAAKSTSEKQLKEALETIIGGLCKQSDRKNEHIPHHHPLETSLNTAVRQYPMFSSLYGCKLGDRMFAKSEEYCKPLGKEINIDQYNVKSNTKEVGGFFKDLINTSKLMNFSYGDM